MSEKVVYKDRERALADLGPQAQAVSQENVEIVKQVLDAYGCRDVETLQALHDTDIEMDWSASQGWLAGVYRGFDDVLRFHVGYFEAFERIVIEAEDFFDGGDTVVVPNVSRQWGRDGIEVTARSALVFTLADGKITRLCLYQELAQALKAVGLAE